MKCQTDQYLVAWAEGSPEDAEGYQTPFCTFHIRSVSISSVHAGPQGWYVIELLEGLTEDRGANKLVECARCEVSNALLSAFDGWSQHSLAHSLWKPDSSQFCFPCTMPGMPVFSCALRGGASMREDYGHWSRNQEV